MAATVPAQAPAATMAAAVLEGPRRLRVARAPVPEPGAAEILVRIEGCGVCGSNVPVWERGAGVDFPLAAGAPGHEAWGEVVAVGREVESSAPGDRVAMLSYRSFAEFDVADAAAAVRLPAALDGEPFPGEALACALNVFRRSGISEGECVAVVGVGFLGALLVQLAARHGARVTAVSRRRSALELARRFGADVAVSADHASLADLDGAFDCVVEAAGTQTTLDLASRLVRVRGRLVVAGYHQDGPRTVDMQLWNWRGLDVVNAHERDPRVYVEGLRAAVDAVASGQLDPAPLYTHRFPLSRLEEALESARTRPDGFMKALVEP